MSEMMEPQAPFEAESAEPVEPAYVGPSPDEWQETQQELAQLREAYQQMQAPQEESFPLIDPFADDYPQQLAAYVSQTVQQAIQPVSEWQYQQQLSEAEERALDIIEDDVSRNGEFLLGERAFDGVRALANSFFAEEAQRYGNGPKAAQTAIYRAAATWREYEKELAQKAIEQHTNQLTTLSGAPREPGVTSFPAGQLTQGARTIDELVSKYAG